MTAKPSGRLVTLRLSNATQLPSRSICGDHDAFLHHLQNLRRRRHWRSRFACDGALVADKKYSIRALSRDATSRRAKALLDLGNAEIVEGTFADEAALREGFRGCDGAYINIDGFNTGEKTEMYWAIRSYEIAIEEGVKFFVYGNLDYALKKAGYVSKFRAGHYDGKGRIGEWILFQNEANKDRMGAAVFTTGPYMKMAISAMTPMT